MSQLTLRISEELARDVKAAAQAEGMSVNQWAANVLRTAVDPEHAGDEMARVRERLARAGLLVDPRAWSRPTGPRPTPEEYARARAAGARGKFASDIVSEDRG